MPIDPDELRAELPRKALKLRPGHGVVHLDMGQRRIIVESALGYNDPETGEWVDVEPVRFATVGGAPGSRFNAAIGHLLPGAAKKALADRVRALLLWALENNKRMNRNALQDDLNELPEDIPSDTRTEPDPTALPGGNPEPEGPQARTGSGELPAPP